METAETLEDLIMLIGRSTQDEPTRYAICMQKDMWKTAPVLWATPGTERIDVYEIALTAKPLRTIVMGESEEGD